MPSDNRRGAGYRLEVYTKVLNCANGCHDKGNHNFGFIQKRHLTMPQPIPLPIPGHAYICNLTRNCTVSAWAGQRGPEIR